MILSIKKRFLYIFISLLLVMVTIVVSRIYFEAKNQIQDLFDAELSQEAHLLLDIILLEYDELLAGNAGSEVLKIQSTRLKGLHKYQKRVFFQVWSADDTLVVRSDGAPDTPLIGLDGVFVDKMVNDKRWRVFSVVDDSSKVRIQVAQQFKRRNTLVGIILNQLVWSVVVLLPLFIVVIYISVNRALLPIKNIAQDIKKRAIDTLEPISLTQVPDEILPIVCALNSLFSRLQAAINDIIVFTSNAAHELRTPLATQKLHAQIAIEAPDTQTRNEALGEVMAGVNRSTQIVEQLLMLARLDPETDLQEHDIADLDQITQDTIGELVPQAMEKNIEISLDAGKQFTIMGKPSLLSVLVRNLVENAIRYTPEKGTVAVSLYEDNHKVILQVADSGPGIPVHEREDVFKRFFRGEQSHHIEGTGLGLAMVDCIAQIHHATIELAESEYNGLQVKIAFQAAKS